MVLDVSVTKKNNKYLQIKASYIVNKLTNMFKSKHLTKTPNYMIVELCTITNLKSKKMKIKHKM